MPMVVLIVQACGTTFADQSTTTPKEEKITLALNVSLLNDLDAYYPNISDVSSGDDHMNDSQIAIVLRPQDGLREYHEFIAYSTDEISK